jgi:hypothetical protein
MAALTHRGGSAVDRRELDFGECDGGLVGGGCAGEVVGEDGEVGVHAEDAGERVALGGWGRWRGDWAETRGRRATKVGKRIGSLIVKASWEQLGV